jgi:TRAP-type C4-dicarboxylate transport system substrate-binding protein
MKSMKMTRRSLLGTMSGASAAAIMGRPVRAAAEFDFKLGVNTPEIRPLSIRLTQAARDIGSRSAGRLNVTAFANSQLGGDPEMLSQVR